MTEILCPAGNQDKLKTAVVYGADAVYLAGQRFGLRSGLENFSEEALARAVSYAHSKGRKVYVAMNAFHHEEDLKKLPEFIKHLGQIGADSAIVSDPGAARLVLDLSPLRLHVSTQASVVNHRHAKIWKDMGASRIVLGREATIEEGARIKEKTEIEIEMFGHGAMCMSYSGHCTISNFTAGRDSNRGGCIQSCRHRYSVSTGEVSAEDSFLSSKDLMSLGLVEKFIDAGIDSLKIEGRMKSLLYAATTARAYSSVAKAIKTGTDPELNYWDSELRGISHRGYTEGSLSGYADASSVYHGVRDVEEAYDQAGYVVSTLNDEETLFFTTASVPDFASNLEFLSPVGGIIRPATEPCRNMLGEEISSLANNQLYIIRAKNLCDGMVGRIKNQKRTRSNHSKPLLEEKPTLIDHSLSVQTGYQL